MCIRDSLERGNLHGLPQIVGRSIRLHATAAGGQTGDVNVDVYKRQPDNISGVAQIRAAAPESRDAWRFWSQKKRPPKNIPSAITKKMTERMRPSAKDVYKRQEHHHYRKHI